MFLMIFLLFFIFEKLKEEIQKKTGYIVMRADGVYDVDANTAIDQLSEDLNIKMPEVIYLLLNQNASTLDPLFLFGFFMRYVFIDV